MTKRSIMIKLLWTDIYETLEEAGAGHVAAYNALIKERMR